MSKKARKAPAAVDDSNDAPEMREAIKLFLEYRLEASRPAHHHLKCGPLNYWPSTGKIYIDNRPRIYGHGLAALRATIKKYRALLS
jgi:hypothetical protein